MLQQLNCPRCQAPITAEIYQVIDAQRTPELKYALLNGQLNTFACPNCGLTGQLASPMLYHDPEHELFMVYVPMELNLSHVEQERLIGQLVKQVMDRTPAEQRRGYMLQPETIINYRTFLEKVLETEGVTPEMIERQRQQAQLVDTLANADRATFAQLVEEHADQIDETFFGLLQNAMQVAQQQGDDNRMVKLTNLQARLYTQTEIGRRMERQQGALRKFEQDVRREDAITPEILLKHILANQEDEAIVDALATTGQSALTYEFFTLLTAEIEQAARQHEKDRVKRLTSIRRKLLDFQKALEEATEEIMERASQTLRAILQADDKRAAIEENLDVIDEPFMYLLSARLNQAEQQGNAADAVKLRQVYDLIMEEAERQVPPQVRLVNRLLRAESDKEQRQALDENAELVTPELGQLLEAVAGELGEDAPAELKERVRRAQAMIAMRTGA